MKCTIFEEVHLEKYIEGLSVDSITIRVDLLLICNWIFASLSIFGYSTRAVSSKQFFFRCSILFILIGKAHNKERVCWWVDRVAMKLGRNAFSNDKINVCTVLMGFWPFLVRFWFVDCHKIHIGVHQRHIRWFSNLNYVRRRITVTSKLPISLIINFALSRHKDF